MILNFILRDLVYQYVKIGHKGHGVSTSNAEFKKSMIVKIKSVLHILKKTDNNRECEVLPKNKFNWVSGLLNRVPDAVVSRQLLQSVAPGHMLLPAASIGRRAGHALLNYGG